jgi:hypothetical protein
MALPLQLGCGGEGDSLNVVEEPEEFVSVPFACAIVGFLFLVSWAVQQQAGPFQILCLLAMGASVGVSCVKRGIQGLTAPILLFAGMLSRLLWHRMEGAVPWAHTVSDWTLVVLGLAIAFLHFVERRRNRVSDLSTSMVSAALLMVSVEIAR